MKLPCLSDRVKPNKSESFTRTAITIELCKGAPVESLTTPETFIVCAKLFCSEKMKNGTNLCLMVELVDIKNALLIDNKAFYSNFFIGIQHQEIRTFF